MTTSTDALLEASRLTVCFGTVTALDGLDLTVPPGEVLAILGPNGAGKTTFVRTVATLLRPTSGTLRVRGVDVARHPTAVRRDIGLAGQSAAVEPTMTGRENLEMTARLFGHHAGAARRAAAAVIEQLSLESVADRRSSTYSGGQRRRLDLGASLVGAPRLLLLDEPTTGLDPTSRMEVWDAIRNLVSAGTDVLLTTHYLDEADELADRVVVIDHGRAVASGTLPELKTSVGRDIIEVTVADGSQLDAIGRILQRVTSNPPRLDHTGRHARAASTGGALELGTVIRLLAGAEIPVDEIGLRRPNLEEVFMTLTGDGAGAGHLPSTDWADRADGPSTDPDSTNRSSTDRHPTDGHPTERHPTDRPSTDRHLADHDSTDRHPTERHPTDRPSADRHPTDPTLPQFTARSKESLR